MYFGVSVKNQFRSTTKRHLFKDVRGLRRQLAARPEGVPPDGILEEDDAEAALERHVHELGDGDAVVVLDDQVLPRVVRGKTLDEDDGELGPLDVWIKISRLTVGST